MINGVFPSDLPGLLVSVRDAAEARAALDGGADVIDVKEPRLGSLGAADPATIAAVVREVAGRVPVTAAFGELLDFVETAERTDSHRVEVPAGVALFKLGLAGCGGRPDWAERWRCVMQGMTAKPVAVAYADWQAAGAPGPEAVLEAAIDAGCMVLLIDTWNKSFGTLFDYWSTESVARFVEHARRQNIGIVLAGSLSGDTLRAAIAIEPDLVAVRGAACEVSRAGSISRRRIEELRRIIVSERLRATQPAGGGN